VPAGGNVTSGESHKENINTTNYVVAIVRGVERELAAWNQGVRNVIEDRG